MTNPYDQHLRDAAGQHARCAVVTLSDTRTEATDKSGATIRSLLEPAGHEVTQYRIIADDAIALEALLEEMFAHPEVDVILTTGGTGIGRRDVTVRVVGRLLEQPLPGFGQLFRMLSWEQIGSGAMLSRAIGGVARGKLIFTMPGSTPAVELAMTRLILPEIKHLLRELRK